MGKLRLPPGATGGNRALAAAAIVSISASDSAQSLDSDFSDSLLGRYFGLMLERMVGPDYERGLVQLKALAESTTPPADAQP